MKSNIASLLLLAIVPLTMACSPPPGATPLDANALLARSPFAFIATALESSQQLTNETIKMKIDCVVKAAPGLNADAILASNSSVTVGLFSGSSLCSVDAQVSQQMMIFVSHVTLTGTAFQLSLRGDESYPHSQTRPVPEKVKGDGLILRGGECPRKCVKVL
jgi:hypothetical protein